ncbi:MAG: hypothetical protein NC102_10395 [Clostridium sp.]|nr:hypothetical protein [Clostridium sp.]
MDLSRINAYKRDFLRVANEVCPGYALRDEHKPLVNDIFRWCMMLDGKLDTAKGLWLYGNIGTGKSTMLEIVKRFCSSVRPKDKKGFPYCFRTTAAVEICGEFAKGGFEGIQTYIDSPRQALDDIGMECVPTGHYSTSLNVIQYILHRRYDKRFDSFTHVTTNLTFEQAAKRYDARIYDRCKEMFNFVEFTGKTFRK